MKPRDRFLKYSRLAVSAATAHLEMSTADFASGARRPRSGDCRHDRGEPLAFRGSRL